MGLGLVGWMANFFLVGGLLERLCHFFIIMFPELIISLARCFALIVVRVSYNTPQKENKTHERPKTHT